MLKYLIIFTLTNTLFIDQMNKQKQPYTLELRLINSKQYLVPNFNLFDCERYMLPKLDNAPVHHTFYQPQQLQQMYEQMKIDPKQLNHNLDKNTAPQKISKNKSSSRVDDYSSIEIKDDSSFESSILEQKSQKSMVKNNPRPPLRQQGYTHFIHIPFWDILKTVYEDQIVPRIQQEDRDLLMPLSSMHMTVLVLRLKKLEDLPLWSQVLKSAKKTKVSIKGVNIFPVKKNFAKVLFLNIKGMEDLIDRVVSKAIQLHLISESQLSNIKFDKVTGTYKAEPHISLLRTKGNDLYDFSEYLKIFSKISLTKASIGEIRLSMIGSHDGKDYFNEEILQL